MEDIYDIEVNATRFQIEEFMESVLWLDICREVDKWIDQVIAEDKSLAGHIMDNNLSTGAALTFLGYIEGRREAINRFKGILDMFLIRLEEKKNDSELERTE